MNSRWTARSDLMLGISLRELYFCIPKDGDALYGACMSRIGNTCENLPLAVLNYHLAWAYSWRWAAFIEKASSLSSMVN